MNPAIDLNFVVYPVGALLPALFFTLVLIHLDNHWIMPLSIEHHNLINILLSSHRVTFDNVLSILHFNEIALLPSTPIYMRSFARSFIYEYIENLLPYEWPDSLVAMCVTIQELHEQGVHPYNHLTLSKQFLLEYVISNSNVNQATDE